MANKANNKEDIAQLLENGIDLKNRRIYFGVLLNETSTGEFNWANIEHTIRALHALSHNSQKPIELYMSSIGGSISDMLRLYDAIQECRCQVKFFGSGEITSSAVYLMSGCDERHLSKHAQIMLHEPQYISDAASHTSYTDSTIEQEAVGDMRQRLLQILSTNSRMDIQWWNTVLQRDVFLSAEEAIVLGIADKIIEPKKRGNLRRARIASLNKTIPTETLRQVLTEIHKKARVNSINKVEISIPKEQHDQEIIIETVTTED